MRLQEKVAIVTGAASGIGLASAELFTREGAHVVAVDRDRAALKGVGERGYAVDVTDLAVAERTVAEVLAHYGKIDVLMTSAGVSLGGDTLTTTMENWDRVFAINVKGTYLWIRAVVPAMLRHGKGSIVTVASQLAFSGGGGNTAYVASKGAIISMTRSIAVEFAKSGIRVNALVPGATETPLMNRSADRQPDPEAARATRRARHAMGRFGEAIESAYGALYLASDDSSFTTGAEIKVDGGWIAA